MATVAQLKLETNDTPLWSGVIEMSPDVWANIPDNPRQRDTEARARRAKHLRTPHPTHCRVNMARLPDGTCYKLDGHTRAFLWASGKLERPTKVHADVYQCKSVADVKALYGTFDSTDAAENVSDKMFGAIRENELEFQSELLKSMRFASGMRFATELIIGSRSASVLSVYEVMEYWLPELRLLDGCRPTRRRFHTGVMAASLITFRRFGPAAAGFWGSFAMGAGTKIDGNRDAVQALDERMELLRLHRKLSGRGNVTQVARICLSAFDAHQRDFTYSRDSSGIKTMGGNSFERWIAAAVKTARKW